MKLSKLNPKGFSHTLVLVAVVVVAAVGGTWALVGSHADAITAVTIGPYKWTHYSGNTGITTNPPAGSVVEMMMRSTGATPDINSKSSDITSFVHTNAGRNINVCISGKVGNVQDGLQVSLIFGSFARTMNFKGVTNGYDKTCKVYSLPSSLSTSTGNEVEVSMYGLFGDNAYVNYVSLARN